MKLRMDHRVQASPTEDTVTLKRLETWHMTKWICNFPARAAADAEDDSFSILKVIKSENLLHLSRTPMVLLQE